MTQETDRELLEMAAKAAGMPNWKFYEESAVDGHPRDRFGMRLGVNIWNPLTDDGNALRLAVKLGLTVHTYGYDEYSNVFSSCFKYDDIAETVCSTRQEHDSDHYAATRRAIVRAAAEIGKAME